MLDKSIPYKRIYMSAPPETIKSYGDRPVPDGFAIRTYIPGDASSWAYITTDAGEFDRASDALEYFNRTFLPYEEKLAKRMLFAVKADTGEPVGTTTAWWFDAKPEWFDAERKPLPGYEGLSPQRKASVHWFAVKESYQRRGIGTALMARMLKLFAVYESGKTVYIPTQTYSYDAIRIYRRAGFCVCRETALMPGGNDYAEAMKVLRAKCGDAFADDLINTSAI